MKRFDSMDSGPLGLVPHAEHGVGQDVLVGPLHLGRLVHLRLLSLPLQVAGLPEQLVDSDAVEGCQAFQELGSRMALALLDLGTGRRWRFR